MAEFVSSPQHDQWCSMLDMYGKVLKLKISNMKNPKGKELLSLDNWYQNELPESICSRKPKHITHGELVKLMKWKLTRGKFRPRLEEMVKTNSEDEVARSSEAAFQALPGVAAAVKHLTVLKAVGPATASAVLAAGSPGGAPFMADESMLALPGLRPLQYTLPFYMQYCERLKNIVKVLKKQDVNYKWTLHKVELVLWTFHLSNSLCPDTIDSGAAPSKRRGCLEESQSSVKKKKKT